MRTIVYGYPSATELSPGMVYGGTGLVPQAPTHYCPHCDTAWYFKTTDEALYIPPPEACDFCGKTLSDLEKLDCLMEYENMFESEGPGRFIVGDTFKQLVSPVCKKCRNGIHENQADLAAEEIEQDRKRDFYFYVLCFGILTIIAALYLLEYLLS